MDFIAGYVSGAAAILIGNPLDVLKVKIQSTSQLVPVRSQATSQAAPAALSTASVPLRERNTLLKGIAAPILTYGALNALLYAAYNRSLPLFSSPSGSPHDPTTDHPRYTYTSHFISGVLAGLATFVVSTPTELVKCRAQIASATAPATSWSITRQILRERGVLGLYHGGVVTALRDAIGYGFYFWTYEATKDLWDDHTASKGIMGNEQLKILMCGGIAGVATWASVFPLDVIKSRVQTHAAFLSCHRATRESAGETTTLLNGRDCNQIKRDVPSSMTLARLAVKEEGWMVLFRGLGVCSIRAFIVNAVQWSVYELVMKTVSQGQGTAT